MYCTPRKLKDQALRYMVGSQSLPTPVIRKIDRFSGETAGVLRSKMRGLETISATRHSGRGPDNPFQVVEYLSVRGIALRMAIAAGRLVSVRPGISLNVVEACRLVAEIRTAHDLIERSGSLQLQSPRAFVLTRAHTV